MGFKIIFENLRHAFTPHTVAEIARHQVKIATINIERGRETLDEGAHHIQEVAGETLRHLMANPSLAENIEHEVLTIGEDIRHELYTVITDITH